MSLTTEITAKYEPELRGLSPSLTQDLASGVEAMSTRLSAEQLDEWAALGTRLANHSLRSWEAASEYFTVSQRVVPGFTFDELTEWAEFAMRLAESSSLIAAAYLRATPDVVIKLPPPATEEVGLQGQYEQRSMMRYAVQPWAVLGERLYHGNWKSISLATLFFGQSSRLLDSLTLGQMGYITRLIDGLAERSYQLATASLESIGDLLADMAAPDREPFIHFAQQVSDASWADTRLYLERAPQLLQRIDPPERARFLDLSARVTTAVGRQGYPLFISAAEAIGTVSRSEHATLLHQADRLSHGSPVAAMAFLTSTPFMLQRLTTDQLDQWYEVGRAILYEEQNADGAEAYFRLESTRAEEVLERLSARVEMGSIVGMLRMYAKALTGEPIAIRSTEELVDKGIGWVEESVATTEGSSIYLPPFVSLFPEQYQNFMTYKVYTTHQTGRMEFGAFQYQLGARGAYTPGTLAGRLHRMQVGPAPTEMQRLYSVFDQRPLIAALFTIVEDTRVDAYVSREYGGIRSWLHELQAFEIERRPEVSRLGLREAFVENLLRASLGHAEAIRWPQALQTFMTQGVGLLRVVEQRDATVQDSADTAALLYDITMRLPNLPARDEDGEWVAPDEDAYSLTPMTGGGEGEGSEMPEMPSSEEDPAFQAPPQPDFRGDFKPELVQLLMKLKQQQQAGDKGVLSPMSREQLMEMLQNNPEIVISDIAEGEFASSVGLFLSNLEKEAGTPQTDSKAEKPDSEDGEDEEGDGGGTEGGELPVEIQYAYYDEWDFRASDYRPRWCRVGERDAEEGVLDYYEETLKKHHGLVIETRRQFELMRPESFRKIKNLEDGEEIDLDRAIEFHIDRLAGVGPLARVYWRRNKLERDVAVAFLVDVSASTDEEIEKHKTNYDEEEEFDGDPRKYFQWLANRRAKQAAAPPKRIIDLEKESLVLVVEALEAIGDSYGIYGFSGYGRDNVEFHVIKDLKESFGDRVRRRIDKIQPVRSTRMGPAIRHTVAKLNAHDAKVKLLIVVSDGRPQDHGYGRDRTEKEYAVHDTHQALVEARRAGITPFLLTVDKEGHDYLKEMCDDMGYEVVDNIEMLPRRLTSLYRALAAE